MNAEVRMKKIALLAAIALIVGASGAVVSITRETGTLATPTLPEALTTAALRLWLPAASADEGVKVQVVPVTVASPKRVKPSNTETLSPLARSPEIAPLKTGWVSRVSVAEVLSVTV